MKAGIRCLVIGGTLTLVAGGMALMCKCFYDMGERYGIRKLTSMMTDTLNEMLRQKTIEKEEFEL